MTTITEMTKEEALEATGNKVLEAEANVFATDPKGFHVHFKLLGPATKIVGNLEILTTNLVSRGYAPDSPRTSGHTASSPAPQSAGPTGVAEWIPMPDGSRSCSIHGPAKWVPPGTSRTTGKPFTGFWACQVKGCKPRDLT